MEDFRDRDKSCRLSAIVDGCDQAYLIPPSEREWWDINMGESSDLQIESALNGILLRTDLHQLFNAGTWVPMAIEGQQLVAYVVRTAEVSNQFAELWHCTEMQSLVGVDRRCLFARVAWAVLSLHYEFLTARRLASENLLVRSRNGELKEIAPKVFEQFLQAQSGTQSPKKQPRLQILKEDKGVIVAAKIYWNNEEENDGDSEAGDSNKDGRRGGFQNCYDIDDDSTLDQRGRKRLRSPANKD